MKRLTNLLVVSGLTGILSLGAFWPSIAQADSKRHFSLEVAMGDVPSGLNFQNDPAFPPPGRGLVVLASGRIFPKNTLPEGPSDADPNGPTGPDAIGSWFCHFIHLGPTEFPLVGAVTYFFKLDGTGK